jgi:hypothetical protein
MNETEIPCILICPMCGQISMWERRGVLVFPSDYITNKECMQCGEGVPLLFLGMTVGSWSLRDKNTPQFIS